MNSAAIMDNRVLSDIVNGQIGSESESVKILPDLYYFKSVLNHHVRTN